MSADSLLRSLAGTGDFYFIRHGESEANRAGFIQGRTHSMLNENGRSQAHQAGLWFRKRHLDMVICSPLKRAEETARIIAETAGVRETLVVDELAEIETGIFTGLSFPQIRERYPQVWREFQRESWEAVPEAEKIAQLLERADLLWSRLCSLHARGSTGILSVSHGGFLQWIIKSTFGGATWMPLVSTADNCCVSHLAVDNRPLDGGGRGFIATWMILNQPIGGGKGKKQGENASVGGDIAAPG